MKKENGNRQSFTLKERLQYRLDNRIAKGSLRLIRELFIFSLILALIMAVLIILFGFHQKRNPVSVFWDSFAAEINGQVPNYGGDSFGYLILMGVSAIGGMLVTSVLIGIITSSIEEKINRLKRGNSLVIEQDHIVVLGFYPGEYTLLHQLILAAEGKPGCIVVAESMERETMERYIWENLKIPGNFRIICRTVDITDPSSLEICSVETCRTVIVNPTEEMRTIKAILAVGVLLENKGVSDVRINAIMSKTEYRFPPSIARAHNITTFQTNDVIAKMIAHSCTQTGLSESFREVFRFEGTEFYLVNLPGSAGLTFEELMKRLNYAVPVGIFREGKILLNPPAESQIQESDRVLIFSEKRDAAKLEPSAPLQFSAPEPKTIFNFKSTNTVIIGHNETLPIVLRELPENVSQVYLAGQNTTQEEQDELQRIADARDLRLDYYPGDLHSETVLTELASMAKHIVVLNDHSLDPEEADTEAIFLVLNLREIRKRLGKKFNITVEMQKEHNQKLVSEGDYTDFLVSSSMASLILAQLAENPELIDVFDELLSNRGNELYLKKVKRMQLEGTYTVRELRLGLLKEKCILLGDMDSEKHSFFNRPLDEKITLSPEDKLIVLGEK